MKKIEKVKTHVKENKKVYIGCVVCLGVGLTAGYFVRGGVKISIDNRQILSWKPVNDSINIITTILEDRTNPAIPIRCVETGEVYGSITRAANLLNLSPTMISRHLRGLSPHVKNLHFEKLSEAAN